MASTRDTRFPVSMRFIVVTVMAPSFYNSVLTPLPDSVIGIPLLSIFMSSNPFIRNESWDTLELFDQNLFFTPSQQNIESFLIRLARFEIKGAGC